MTLTANLMPQSRQSPDLVRAIGLAAVIAVNLSLFAYLMLPPGITQPSDFGVEDPPVTWLVPIRPPIIIDRFPRLPYPSPHRVDGLVPVESPAPVYPVDLIRDGITGTVQLELLVDTDGRVIEIRIVHSCGNREMDRVALDQVLHHWRFRPAMRNGVAVQAVGRVPIVFTLD